MEDFLNLIRREIDAQVQLRLGKKFGIVTSYDPTRHLAKVTIQPYGQETGWLPIRTMSAGNGWGVSVGLTPGTQVELMPQDGDINALAVAGLVHSETDVAPVAQAGEIVIQSASGLKVTLTSAGITLDDGAGAKIVMNGGTTTVTGDLHVSGAVIAGYGGGDAVGLQTHTHPGVPAPNPGT